MKHGSAVWFVLLLSASALAAQNAAPKPKVFQLTPPGSGPNQLTIVRLPPGCPVSLHAQHLADGMMVRTGSTHPQGLGQWLHLALAGYRSSQAVKATVTVHGFSGKARITEAAGGDGSSDAKRTMTMPLSAESGQSVAGDLWVPGMTAVQTIDLDSVAYADGSVWNFTGQESCRVVPDPLMLIAGR
jgi:hypothetical protein